MFKLLTQKEQLRMANMEIARLNSILGKIETVPIEENEQVEQPKLIDRIESLETIELERILGGV